VFFEKPAIALVADFRQQRGDGWLDVTHQPQINGCATSNVLRIPVYLDFLA
jgi:hypothetical protein